MSFLRMKGKQVLVAGVANRKSVAFHVASALREAGAGVLFSVRDETAKAQAEKLFPDSRVYVCDVERQEQIDALGQQLADDGVKLAGLVHSIAFANYSKGLQPFHATVREDFLQAINISCFSFVALANALKDCFEPDASAVTISISTTRMASESYGYMAPIKAALDSSVCFLAKSFSTFSRVRFNAVCAGLLKTSASAGIPGYIDNYLYAEKATLRKDALKTEEVADVVAFLLSPRSAGINAQRVVVDAGMEVNYFDKEIVYPVTHAP